MKGITPVIAIILLLLITISMVGFAFLWFTEFAEMATQGTENTTKQWISTQQKTISIIHAADVAPNDLQITVRNTGSAAINADNEVIVFVGDSVMTCSWDSATIMPATASTCQITDGTTCTGEDVKVSSPGNQDIVTCS